MTPGILEHVGIEGDDAHERSFESVEHPGLNLGGARETAGLGLDLEFGRAEIVEERGERDGVRARRDHAVVIAGDGDDRRRILAIRFIELVVVILRLTEIVDHVAKMKKEMGDICGRFLVKIGDHLIGDQRYVFRPLHRPGVADRVKHELTRLRDRLDDVIAGLA